jgi:hypothetical protein
MDCIGNYAARFLFTCDLKRYWIYEKIRVIESDISRHRDRREALITATLKNIPTRIFPVIPLLFMDH